MFHHLDSHIVYFIFSGLFLIAIAVVVFYFNKKWGIISLVIASLVLGFAMASIDPFLNLWDEQQHALVAKHLAENPFKPTLYKTPLLDYSFESWVGNHIWVHKQPLFLWQMALSIKIFGTTALAVRIPSVILHALLTYLVYRIGKSIKNEQAGFIAAILITVSHYPLELVSGRYATDHNDMSFLFYTAWSVLCWVEYQKTQDKKWLIWLGISAGCAVLVKWLMGLVIYVCWFLLITIQNKFRVYQIRSYFVMIKPFLISLLVFIPWQIYIFIRFPKEAKHEIAASSSHFSEVVEGHGGEWNYHFTTGFKELYFSGDLMPYLLLLIIILGIFFLKNNRFRIFVSVYIFFIYAFYSIAATKMHAFPIISMPLVVICFGVVMEKIYQFLGKYLKPKILPYFIMIGLITYPSFAFFKWDTIQTNHSKQLLAVNANRQEKLKELATIMAIKEKYGNSGNVIFNANMTLVGHIPFMFFTDNIAYPYPPTEDELQKAEKQGYQLIILDNGVLEDHLRKIPDIYLHSIER
ncbi:MAG: glycosyltransferase family 39 protein [Crocinitomicaceae bacterium]